MVQSTSAFTCGNWTDVPSNYKAILTDICEYGLMQGKSETDYGFGDNLLRIEAAVIVNRLALGSETYDTINYDLSEAVLAVEEAFVDAPESTIYTTWIIKAMFYSNSNGIMTGDDDGRPPTTFRPYDAINIPETFKVFFEGLGTAGVFSDKVEYTNLDYTLNPWFKDLMNVMEKEGVITGLNYDTESFTLNGDMTTSYSAWATEMQREDAALFLHTMIQANMVDETALEAHVNS